MLLLQARTLSDQRTFVNCDALRASSEAKWRVRRVRSATLVDVCDSFETWPRCAEEFLNRYKQDDALESQRSAATTSAIVLCRASRRGIMGGRPYAR